MDARSNYELVLNAAEALDVGKLVELYRDGVPIDSFDDAGLFTPAATLATRHNVNAVELLRAFGANLSRIVLGYAAGNCTLEVLSIVRNHCIDLNLLAIGAGMTFNDELRAILINEFDLAAEWVVFGAMMSDQEAYVEKMLTHLKNEFDKNDDQSYAAAFQSSYLTYLYARKMKHGSIHSAFFYNEALEFPHLIKHVSWVARLERRNMYCGDRELQAIINELYSKKNPTNIQSNKRIIDLQHHKNLFDVVNWLQGCDMHYHGAALTYELTFVENSDFVLGLMHADASLRSCCEDAMFYRRFMLEFHFDYRQAMIFHKNKSIRNALATSVANEGEKYFDVMRQLSQFQVFESDEEASNMLQKYYLAQVKLQLIKLLEEFCSGKDNILTSLFTNPKLSRLDSLKIGIAYIESLKDLHELICFESSLLSNSFVPVACPLLLPYHLQPLANRNTDAALVELFAGMSRSNFFKPALATPEDCGYMIEYKDITQPNPIDPVNVAAVNAARNYFVSVLSDFIAKHQSSVWNFSLFGNQTHKIERVTAMQAAASRAASRQELMTIALHQFGLYNNLTKPKPHPQAPKHLSLMSDGVTSPEFRQMVEALLTCDNLKPGKFK